MSTLTVKELAAPTGYDLKIASGETLDLKSQGTVTMPAGHILQVVQATRTNTQNGGFLLATNSASFQATTLTASITPSSTSSKIYVMVNSTIYTSNNASVTLFRDSTNIGGSTYGFGRLTNPDDVWETVSITYLDSPSTTSSITYKLGARSESSNIYVGGDSDQINSITLMEVAG